MNVVQSAKKLPNLVTLLAFKQQSFYCSKLLNIWWGGRETPFNINVNVMIIIPTINDNKGLGEEKMAKLV